MLKNKKSLAVILSLVMLLAMACGAWAADAKFDADGPTNSILNASGDISVSGGYFYGLWAHNGGKIIYKEPNGTLSTSGDFGFGIYAEKAGEVEATGNITTNGANARGMTSAYSSDIVWTGGVVTHGPSSAGAYAHTGSSIDFTGDILTKGEFSRGLVLDYGGYIKMVGNITTEGTEGYGIKIQNNETGLEYKLELTGSITTYGDDATAVLTASNADVILTDCDITTSGENATGIDTAGDSTITMEGGTITVADNGTSWSMSMHDDSTINLDGVTAEGQNLLNSDSSGTLTATGGSALTGDVLHDGAKPGDLNITIIDSSLNSSANASGDVGVINISLEGSNWNITGDSNINGTVTGDGNSVINYTLASDDTTVIIDSLKGNPELNIKPGDKLIIKDTDGVIVDFGSSDNDVITVIKTDDGYEITSVGDGPATIKLSYQLPDGGVVTYEFGVVSGSGNKPESNNYGSGGSSNCNAGMGIGALVSLFGLALVMRKK